MAINEEYTFSYFLLITYPHGVTFFIANTTYSSFNHYQKKMSWDDNTTDLLKKYWSQGLTASQIAQKIGNVTRNAVIGKAHRLNLQARATSKKTRQKINTEENNTAEVNPQKLGRKARFKALLLDKNFEQENPKKLEELTDETCRWPIGHPYEEKFYFCGRKPMEKFPYCKLHVLYAFQPKNAKEEDQITEEDIPILIEKKIKAV